MAHSRAKSGGDGAPAAGVRPFKAKSLGGGASRVKAKTQKSMSPKTAEETSCRGGGSADAPLKRVQEATAVSPPAPSGEASARTSPARPAAATADEDVEAKVKLACDSARKKRTRRKTVCFGDWVTNSPPPAIAKARAEVAAEVAGDRLSTPPRAAGPSEPSATASNGCKTPSHAEILNMSKQLSTMASTLLPETPGTTEKGGGPTLKERLAESWCGKSYYERLAEMNGADQAEEEDDETIDDLQSKIQEALSGVRASKKKPAARRAKAAESRRQTRQGRRRTMGAGALEVPQRIAESPEAAVVEAPAAEVAPTPPPPADAEEESRRKSWADVVADAGAPADSDAQQAAGQATLEREGEKDELIRSLKSDLEESKRKQVVLECQKRGLQEDKEEMRASLCRLREFASELTGLVSALTREVDALSARCG